VNVITSANIPSRNAVINQFLRPAGRFHDRTTDANASNITSGEMTRKNVPGFVALQNSLTCSREPGIPDTKFGASSTES